MKNYRFFFIVLYFLFLVVGNHLFVNAAVSVAEILAFPGAVGFGSTTIGGRGGRVIEVVNLNDSGSGSFREACSQSGKRIIVFKTGGTIKIKSNIKIANPFITIAGQSAPGDGITIRGAALTITTHEVILRCIRIRVGDDLTGPDPGNRDCLQIENKNDPPYNIIIDHCSISWGIDENIALWWPGLHNVTISNCISSEALYRTRHHESPHSMGLIIGHGVYNISIIENLLAHNDQRNPRIKGSVAVINNVVYNRGYKDVDIGGGTNAQYVSVVGNHFIKGKSFKGNSKSIYIRGDVPSGSKIFVEDNIYSDYSSDKPYNNSTYIVKTAPIWPSGVNAKNSDKVLDSVLTKAGAYPYARDAVDVRIVENVKTGTGQLIDSQSQVGGWPNLKVGTSPTDKDHDGMPDLWEIERNLNPNDKSDGNLDRNGDGFTNVEEYLNGLLTNIVDCPDCKPPDNLRAVP